MTRSSSPGSAIASGRSGGTSRLTWSPPVIMCQCTADHVVEPDRAAGNREDPGLQSGQVQQIGDQCGEPVERAVGGGQQLLPILLAPVARHRLRRLDTAALAEAIGVRRSWLTALSSAVRVRSVSASLDAASAASASRRCW